MIDTAQAVLLLVVVILAALLIVLGVQVFFILKELRTTITKANKVLDNTSSITESISGPISTISTLTAGLKIGGLVSSLLKKRKVVMDKVFGDEEEE